MLHFLLVLWGVVWASNHSNLLDILEGDDDLPLALDYIVHEDGVVNASELAAAVRYRRPEPLREILRLSPKRIRSLHPDDLELVLDEVVRTSNLHAMELFNDALQNEAVLGYVWQQAISHGHVRLGLQVSVMYFELTDFWLLSRDEAWEMNQENRRLFTLFFIRSFEIMPTPDLKSLLKEMETIDDQEPIITDVLLLILEKGLGETVFCRFYANQVATTAIHLMTQEFRLKLLDGLIRFGGSDALLPVIFGSSADPTKLPLGYARREAEVWELLSEHGRLDIAVWLVARGELHGGGVEANLTRLFHIVAMRIDFLNLDQPITRWLAKYSQEDAIRYLPFLGALWPDSDNLTPAHVVRPAAFNAAFALLLTGPGALIQHLILLLEQQ